MADKQHNVGDLKAKIAQAIGKVRSLKNDRTDVNADIQSVREGLNALGIPKPAFDMALRYLDWDEEKRMGFDLAYALVREAGGAPLQEDLFQAAERMAAEASDKPAAQADASAIAKVFASEDEKTKTKTAGKKVLPSSTGTGSIN